MRPCECTRGRELPSRAGGGRAAGPRKLGRNCAPLPPCPRPARAAPTAETARGGCLPPAVPFLRRTEPPGPSASAQRGQRPPEEGAPGARAVAGRAAGHGGGTPRPSPPAQRRGPFCPSPPCLCAAGTGIFHLPAPLVVTSAQSSQAPALVSGVGMQGQRELLPPPRRRTLILTRAPGVKRGRWQQRGEGTELAVGGPGDLPFPGNPAIPVLPLHVQPLRHKFAFSRLGPISPARDNIGP